MAPLPSNTHKVLQSNVMRVRVRVHEQNQDRSLTQNPQTKILFIGRKNLFDSIQPRVTI